MSQRAKLTEAVIQERKITVEGNVLKDVKLLGLSSANGRIYLANAVQEALSLYESAKCNLDHDWWRTVEKRFARVKNVRFENNELRGDVHCNPTLAMFAPVKWWAENDPGMIGMSHVVDAGFEILDNGIQQITKIYAVEAVDLVADPATTKGLGESMDKNQPSAVTLPPGVNITIAGPAAPVAETKAKVEPATAPPPAAESDEVKALRKQAREGVVLKKGIALGLPATHLTGAFLEQMTLAPDDATLDRWLTARKEELASFHLVPPPPVPPKQPPAPTVESAQPISGKDLAARLLS